MERPAEQWRSSFAHGSLSMETKMKKYLFAVSAIAIMTSGSVFAAGEKLSQAECDALWMQANPNNAATISETQAKGYVSDFKAANPDNDGTLDKAEFTKACNNGLVSGSASSGASTGSSGSSGSSN
jgi:Ca2+-binding EF-hand superfamily protein